MVRRSVLVQAGLGAAFAVTVPALAATQTVVVWSRDAGVPAPIVAAFEAAHPDIKIDNVGVPCGQLDDKLGVALAANQRIDVVLNPCMRTWPYLAHKGYFTDLNPYVKRDRAALDAGGVIPLAYQIQEGPNGLSGVAFQLRTGLMVTYNVDHFDAAGLARPAPTWGASWTWDDFLADAKKLTLTDPAGKTKQYAVDFWDSDPTAVGFPEAWGGSVLPADAYTTRIAQRFTLNTPENVAGYEAMIGLSRLGLRGGSQSGFRGEKTSMWLDVGDAGYQYTFHWAPAPFPAGPAGSRPLPTWPSYAGIPATSQAPEAAWQFLEFLMTKGGSLRDEKGNFWRGGVTRDSWAERAAQSGPSALPEGQLLDFYVSGISGYTEATPADIIPNVGALLSQNKYALWRELQKAEKGQESVKQALEAAEPELNAQLADLNKQL